MNQRIVTEVVADDVYLADDFHDEDMDFIESETVSDAEFFGFDEEIFKGSNKENEDKLEEGGTLLKVPVANVDASRTKLKEKPRFTFKATKVRNLSNNATAAEVFKEKWAGSYDHVVHIDDPDKNLNNNKTEGNKTDNLEASNIPISVIEDPTRFNTSQFNVEQSTDQIPKNEIQLNFLEEDEDGLINQEEYVQPDFFEDELEELDDSEDLIDDELDILFPQDQDFSEELIWDDFEDVDEFEELARRETVETIQTEGKLDRDQRSLQVAVEVIAKNDFDEGLLPLLHLIFYENGWSAARSAVEKLLNKGVQPEELALARKIKLFWSGSDRYWISFHGIYHYTSSRQAHAAYRHMSWLEALRIIKCFPSTPSVEEIYQLIEDTYEHWYNSDRLRKSFKAFFKYLKYRTGSMSRTLPADCMYSFIPLSDENSGLDSIELIRRNSQERIELWVMGVELDTWPKAPENIIEIKNQGSDE
jgi:hypothetical protein